MMPDRWVVLHIKVDDEEIRKLFHGSYGGFAGSDTWNLNSGIVKQVRHGDTIEFHGVSGSVYYCNINSYGQSVYMQTISRRWLDSGSAHVEPLESTISQCS